MNTYKKICLEILKIILVVCGSSGMTTVLFGFWIESMTVDDSKLRIIIHVDTQVISLRCPDVACSLTKYRWKYKLECSNENFL